MKKLLVAALISGTAYGAWNLIGGDDDNGRASTQAKVHDVKATDRIWLDRIPRTERDTINAFLTVTEENVGVFHNGSAWKASYELFRFEAHANEIQIVYPQTGDREKVTAKATQCDEKGMDYCLELEGSSRGVKRYYSMKGWEIDGAFDVNAKLDTILKATASGTPSRDR